MADLSASVVAIAATDADNPVLDDALERQDRSADTSIFIAPETGRQLDTGALPEESCVSVITLAELQAGVLLASEPPRGGQS